MVKRFNKDAWIAVFCTNVTRLHMKDPNTQASKTYRSSVTNGMQNTVIKRSDTTRLRVERFEESLRLDEKSITTKIGIFPANEIAAMENSDTVIRSRSPFVKIQLEELQRSGPLELLAVVLVILFGCF